MYVNPTSRQENPRALRRALLLVPAIISLVLLSFQISASRSETTITGTVARDHGEVLEDVSISIEVLTRSVRHAAKSNPRGQFQINVRELFPDQELNSAKVLTLVFEKSAFNPFYKNISVSELSGPTPLLIPHLPVSHNCVLTTDVRNALSRHGCARASHSASLFLVPWQRSMDGCVSIEPDDNLRIYLE